MATSVWREPTEKDLSSSISAAEIEAYRKANIEDRRRSGDDD